MTQCEIVLHATKNDLRVLPSLNFKTFVKLVTELMKIAISSHTKYCEIIYAFCKKYAL